MAEQHEFHCYACDHIWESKTDQRTVECPKCHASGDDIKQLEDEEE